MSSIRGVDVGEPAPQSPAVSIVGIGSSAGGLEALQSFFSGLPAHPGMAFVVVSHLDPTHTSSLPEILGKATCLPVVAAQDNTPLEADHVYVLAPNAGLAVRNGVSRTTSRPAGHLAWRPIDEFLISLAKDQKELALAVILSGAGADGSIGIASVKMHNGVVLAQAPETAAFGSMPQNAINTGCVDRVLPPEQLAAVLGEYATRESERELRFGSPTGKSQAGFHELLDLVRSGSGHDFTRYKPGMLRRRTARRMRIRCLTEVADYTRFVRAHPEELAALADDFLISVTSFFRDAPAWKALQRLVVMPLVRNIPAGETVRVWVPGCATGEEAYSVAMVFLEEAAAQRKSLDLRVFATDLSASALAAARAGVYPASIDLQVSAERLGRFFDRNGETYRVKKDLRDRLVFAPHNLLTDPPFSRLHLISCRNVLIYLEPSEQHRILKAFCSALQSGGYLFLGHSESVDKGEDSFQPISRPACIFQRTNGVVRSDIHASGFGLTAQAVNPAAPPLRRAEPNSLEARVRASLAARYAPASVVIDSRFQVLYFHGAMDDLVSQPAGAPTRDLRRLLRDGLSPGLMSAVRRVSKERQPVTLTGGRLELEGQEIPVSVTVCPLPGVDGADDALLVSFAKQPPRMPVKLPAESEAPVEQLLAELAATRAEHRGMVESLESANAELAAVGEELLSTSEEFQVTNEELQTSQEELQALNEELVSLNQELRLKVEALESSTADVQNILTSSGIATVFLAADLTIRWFGATAAELLGLVAGDIGRPVRQLAHPLLGAELLTQAERAMRSVVPSEAEILDDGGRWYLRRIAPYRTSDGRVEGVLALLMEITARKEAELRLAETRGFALAVAETIPTPLLILDEERRVQAVNPAFCQAFSVTPNDFVGQPLYELRGGEWNIPALRNLLDQCLPTQLILTDVELRHTFAGCGERVLLLRARQMPDRPLLLLSLEDITDRKRTEAERSQRFEAEQKSQALTIREAHHRIKNNLQAVSDLLSLELYKGSSPEAAPALQASLGRVQAIAIVHDLLTHQSPEHVNMQQVVERLLPLALSANGLDPGCLELRVQVAAIQLRSREASLVSLFLNELISNCAKHAFSGRHTGKLEIRVAVAASEVSLTVQDDGPGLPPGFQLATHSNVGLEVAQALGEGSLNGRFSLKNDHGCRAEITFPLPDGAKPGASHPTGVMKHRAEVQLDPERLGLEQVD